MRKLINSFLAIALVVATALVGQIGGASAARAAGCDDSDKYKSIGNLKLGSINAPLVSFTYPAGGIMDPPNTTAIVAVSSRHVPLSGTQGTSILIWHRDWSGCLGVLNSLFDSNVGRTFVITDEKGKKSKFEITKALEVKRGNYKKSWFTLNGPRQIVLVTCSGPFENGHHLNNSVYIAKLA